MKAKPEGSEINVTSSDRPSQPAIAISAYDRFAIVWQGQSQDGTSTEIYERLYRSTGTPLKQAFQVNKTSRNNQTDPAVDMDGSGNSVVVWSSNNADGSSDIYGQRLDTSGQRLGSEFLVNSSTVGSQTAAAVALDLNGDFVVTWTSNSSPNPNTKGRDTSGTGVYAQRFMQNGTPLGREFLVNDEITGNQQNSAIAINSQGDYVIAWESSGQDGSGKGIFAQRYNSNGTRLGSEFSVNRTTMGDQDHPSVGIGAAGNFVIAWESSDSDGTGIYAQRFSANGNPQGPEFRVNSTIKGEQITPSLGMDAEGNFTVTWASSGNGFDIYAQHYGSSGQRSGGQWLVNRSQNQDQTQPAIATAANGNFVIAWGSDNQAGQDNQVVAQQYITDPLPLPANVIKGTKRNDIWRGSTGHDKIYGYGGNDKLYGYPRKALTDGNDQLYGGAGRDELNGGAGNDILSGDAGNDILNGGSGNDVLYGGSGQDTLRGGLGNDIFQIGQASGADTLVDFKKGSDRLELLEGLKFKNLRIVSQGTETRISVGFDLIAILKNSSAIPITAADFTNP